MEMDQNLVTDVVKQFQKSELMSVCEELGIEVSTDTTSKYMVKMIFENLDKEGIPVIEDCSELLGEFLVTTEVVDENGDIIEKNAKKEEGKPKPQPKQLAAVEEPEDKPECYTYQDDLDPACKKCLVVKACKAARIAARPACYGLHYEANDEQCKQCLEALFCQSETTANKASIIKFNSKHNKKG